MDSPSILQTDKCGYRYKQKESAYLWVAPNSKTEKFFALCGQFSGPMLVATPVTLSQHNEEEIEEGEFISMQL
jgi:hypothetical protein